MYIEIGAQSSFTVHMLNPTKELKHSFVKCIIYVTAPCASVCLFVYVCISLCVYFQDITKYLCEMNQQKSWLNKFYSFSVCYMTPDVNKMNVHGLSNKLYPERLSKKRLSDAMSLYSHSFLNRRYYTLL